MIAAPSTDSLATCQAAIAADPSDKRAYLRLGALYQQGDRLEVALRAYLRGIEDSRQPSLQEQYRRVPHYSRATQVKAHSTLGIFLYEDGYWEAALAAFRRVIALDDTYWEGYWGQGDVWRDREDGLADRDRACAAYFSVLERDPSQDITYAHLARLLEGVGEQAQALQCGRKWLPAALVQQYLVDSGRGQPWQWVELARSGLRFQTIYPAATVQLAASRSIDPHPDLQATAYDVSASFVAEIPGGRCWADGYTSAVFSPRGELVRELCLGSAELIAASRQLPEPTLRAGTTALLSVAGGAMFCHWFLNVLSRLALLEAAGWGIDRLEGLVVNAQLSPYQRQAIALLDIPPAKLVASLPNDRHLQCEHLLVPSLVDRATPWVCQSLRDRFLRPEVLCAHPPVRRLYISRDRAKYRQVVNEGALIDILVKDYGFRIVLLETLRLSVQISLLAQAEVVVAPHGAGLTHLVFCQPGTRVLELFSPEYVPSYFWELANLVGLEHYHLIGEPLAPYLDPEQFSEEQIALYQGRDPGAAGLWIDGDRLRASLALMGL